jgi:hypothetical protein
VVSAKSLSIVLAAATLAACGGRTPTVLDRGAEVASQDASGVAPPRVDTVRVTADGLMLGGSAPANGQVRLANPGGQALFAPSGPQGRWSLGLPPASEPRIFGLSASVAGRVTQAEGYVLVTPDGHAALLRSGTGARRLDAPSHPGLRTIDFDRGGGLEVATAVGPGATVIVQLDGRQVAEGRADASGRYEASLGSPNPVRPGAHQVEVFGDGFSDRAAVQLTPAAPLAQGPLRSQLTLAGLRVDWMTPGGGVQSTILVH